MRVRRRGIAGGLLALVAGMGLAPAVVQAQQPEQAAASLTEVGELPSGSRWAALGALPLPSRSTQSVVRFPKAATRPRPWVVLVVAQHGAAVFDAWTTRRAMRSYHELNPLLRPVARSAALYPAMQVLPVLTDLAALRLARSQRSWLRRLWWLPQVALTTGLVSSGIHNLRLPLAHPARF